MTETTTLQTPEPLQRTPLGTGHRPADWFATLAQRNTAEADPLRGGLELEAPYQRGQVWTRDQQRALVTSFLRGIPVPAVLVNDRFTARFRHEDGRADWRYAVVDGKQRVSALLAWYAGELDIPASWLPVEAVAGTHATADGAYVTAPELTAAGRLRVSASMHLQVAEAQLRTLRAEAELYLLLNRGGTTHAEADLACARALTR